METIIKERRGGWKPRAFSGRIITEKRIDIIAAGGWSKGEAKGKDGDEREKVSQRKRDK